MAADAIQGFGSIVFAQIRYLVVNLNKKNQKSSMSEIAHLLGMYGEGAFIYLIQCLVEEIDFRDAKLQKDQLKVQLLAQEFGKLAGKPNFTQAVTQIFGSATLATPLTEEFLVALVKAIKAPMNQARRRCRVVPSPATPPPCTARAAAGSLAPGSIRSHVPHSPPTPLVSRTAGARAGGRPGAGARPDPQLGGG